MKTKSKRFWIIATCLLFTKIIGIFAVVKGMETLAVTCVGAVMAEGLGYTAAETKKPSK